MNKLKKEGALNGEDILVITKQGKELSLRMSLVRNAADDLPRRYYGTLIAGSMDAGHESLVGKVLDSAKDQILALDTDKRYIVFNVAHANLMRALTGKEIQVGDKILESIPRELVPLARKELKKAFDSDRYHTEVTLPNKLILKTSSYVIRDEGDRVSGIAIFAEDISERKKTELKLKALNEELTFQNWQLAAREEDLRMAMDQLSERNFELDQLMYKTSHDLRSPLSSILGLVNLANLDPNPATLGQYLKKIEGRIKKLDEFISSMVNYARVNRGEITVGEINLERMVKAAIHELEYLDNFQAVKTSVVLNNGHVPFRNDHFLMNIIVGNVISNAYKYYNPEVDSYLRITIDVRDSQATLEFADNGIGIRKEHQDKIFDMFYRATDRSQGSGLGMYIVRQAIEKVEGTISVKSTYGSGTSIRISVPNL
jgi:signal transduction histidine kinase